MDWHGHVQEVRPHVVRIETPRGHGTGFLRYRHGAWFGIATARHVVAHAQTWEQPIRVFHESSSTPVTLRPGNRGIALHSDLDVAIVVGRATDEALSGWPAKPLDLIRSKAHLRQGVAVGWLGYPHLVEDGTQCCFFSGSISAFRDHRYFVDGVAIHGVSGGPAFCAVEDGEQGTEKLVVIGTISEYRPNNAAGDSLPGVAVADDVSGLHSFDKLTKALGKPPQPGQPAKKKKKKS